MHVLLACLFLSATVSSLSAQDPSSSECGPLELQATGKVMTLVSPYYPDLYPSDVRCPWLLTSNTGDEIVIKIDDVFIEDSPNCSSDYLSVYRGHKANPKDRIAKFCGRGISKTIRTGSSRVLIEFVSDVSVEERGFKLQYHSGEEQGCHTVLTSLSGVVTSPRYPTNYPDLADCSTLIRLPPGQRIFLSFQDLTMEYDDDCKSDFVQVYDGATSSSKSLGRFCSFQPSMNLQSSSNELFLAFHSDSLVNAKGFKAVYSSEGYQGVEGLSGSCSWEKSDLNGTVSSPGYPNDFPQKADCKIRLEGPKGSTLALVLEDLDIPECGSNYLEVQEERRRGPVTLRLCGNLTRVSHKRLFSRGNVLTIIFKTGSAIRTSGRGFRARYFILEDTGEAIKQLLSFGSTLDRFHEYPQNSTVKLHDIHDLICSPKDGVSRWFKDRVPVDPGRFSGITLNENTLTILSMTPEHAGIYTCLDYSKDGLFAVNAWVAMAPVKDCPRVTVVRQPPDRVMVLEGNDLTIDCSPVSGNVKIGWLRNGKRFKPTTNVQNGKLKVQRLTLLDSGVYQCFVEKTCQEKYSVSVIVERGPTVCGTPKFLPDVSKPKKDNEHRIVGGRSATRGAYPWQVSLYHKRLQLSFCGASLLTSNWILTAAHCYVDPRYRPEDTEARLGKNNINIIEVGQMVSQLHSLHVHHLYQKGVKHEHDIALLKLVRQVSFSEYISPVCLGSPSKIEEVFFKEGTYPIGIVTGWGDLFYKGEQPSILQEVALPIQAFSKCRSSTSAAITENMFCAGYDEEIVGAHLKKDACQGDSGGPFVVKFRNRWVVVGIVSWGDECGKPKTYGFYTRVNKYHNWISNITSIS